MEEEKADRFAESLGAVIDTPEGRYVLKTILEVCGTEVNMFSEKPSLRDFHLGRQSIGMQIAQSIRDLEPRAWPKFLIDCEDDNERFDSERQSDE
jgi:hypothetical protein